MYNKDYKTIIHKVKDLRRYPGFNPINFTFSENSNYGWERYKDKTLLGDVNKTFVFNVLPLPLKQTFPPIV